MSAPVQTSACVDCATPIIGDQLRCPACAQHAEALAEADDTRALPRVLLSWLLIVEILAMLICGLVLAARCVA